MMTDMKDGPRFPELPFDPDATAFEHRVYPPPLEDRALLGRKALAEGFRSEAWNTARSARLARRQRRAQLAAAGLAGAVVALLWRKGLDRG